jgi:hypothetical protein
MANALDIIASYLVADSGVQALVGAVQPRVYPMLAMQNSVLPNIVLLQISESDGRHLTGIQAQYPEARVSVVSRGSTATEMMNLADAVKAALRDIIHADMGSPTEATDICIYRGDTDMTMYAEEGRAYEQTTDFYVRYRQVA